MSPSVPASPHDPTPGVVPVRCAPRRGPAPARVLRLVAGGCLLAALALCLVAGWGEVPVWAWPALSLVLFGVQVSSQPGPPPARRRPFPLSEGVVAAAFVVSPGAWTVASVACAVLLVEARRPHPRLKRDVDLARAVLGVAAGQAVASVLGGGVVAAAAGLLALETVGCLLTAFAVSATTSRPLGSLLLSSASATVRHAVGSGAVGLLAGWLLLEAPAGLLGLAVPLLLLQSSYDRSTSRGAEVQLLAELARGQGGPPGRSEDERCALLVTTTARLLGGADVELLLLAADGPVLVVGDESGAPERHRVSADVFDDPWVLRALGRPGTSGGQEDDRPCLSTVLGPRDRPLAVLRARRGPNGRSFERRELRLVDVLVAQCGLWLEPQDAATGGTPQAVDGPPGPADAGTAAALHLLAASADRLARLAERPGEIGDVVDELVEEVHLAQRAVASIVGARALGTAPETADAPWGRPTEPVGTGSSRRAAEWTTTGVLP